MHLYPVKEKKEIYKPEAFLKYLAELDENYNNTERKNPNGTLNLILNTLHQELNKKKNVIKNSDIFNKTSVIESGFENFYNNNDSIISKLFYWFEIKELRCNGYLRTRYDFCAFNIFELDILGAFQCN